jgi:O-antigen/teichoic acid export membrane protein
MAQTSLKILAVGQLFNVGLGPVGTLLVMMGRERDAIVAIGAGALANIALTLTLAPRWGAEGAAVAYSLGMIFWNIWAVVVLWRRMIIDSTALGRFSS